MHMYKATTVSKVSALIRSRCCCCCCFLEWSSVKNVEYIELNALVFSRLTAFTRLQETIGGIDLLWETIGDKGN